MLMLGAVAEQALWQRWRDHHDISAAHHLTGSYLRLAVTIAMSYRGYGLASEELIGEAYVGLMHAVCQFDPGRGVRFATYAIWWVRATILECILRNRPPVKMGTAASQKKLFVSLRSVHGHLQEFHNFTLKSKHVSSMVDLLRMPEHEIIGMNPRMASTDHSPDSPIGANSHRECRTWLMDDDGDDQETVLAVSKEAGHRTLVLSSAVVKRTTRERQIVVKRRLG